MSGWRRSLWALSAAALAAPLSQASLAQTSIAQIPAQFASPAAPPQASAATTPVTIAPIDSIDAIESPSQVMALPPELKARLHEALGATRSSQKQRLDGLIRFVFAADGLDMRYREDATHSVAQSYARREANCVGFTLLFLALAREAGLDASPQGIRRTLAWRQDDRTLYRSNHVNVGVVLGARPHTVDFAIEPIIARDPPARISDRRLLAHYYNNLAMEALAIEDMPRAQRLMALSLELDPDYPPHWSNAGVVHLRHGNAAAAATAYAHALSLDAHEPSALFNLASLARRAGDTPAEAEFMRRLSRVQQDDPFHHFMQAINYERSGNDARAVDHYRKAIRLHGREPRFHAALAQAYYRIGDLRRASRALRHARALSTGTAREDYAAELDRWAQASRTR
jgi:Flp pilus assembly protein TadD